jgi:hypothetical protein
MLTPSRNHSSNNNVDKGKTLLKGRSEIQPFLNIVIMANDRLRYGIEIISESFGHLSQLDSTSISTVCSSIISALVTFYRKDREDKLKGNLPFILFRSQTMIPCDYITQNYVQNNKKRIETRCIQFCKSESFLYEPNK